MWAAAPEDVRPAPPQRDVSGQTTDLHWVSGTCEECPPPSPPRCVARVTQTDNRVSAQETLPQLMGDLTQLVPLVTEIVTTVLHRILRELPLSTASSCAESRPVSQCLAQIVLPVDITGTPAGASPVQPASCEGQCAERETMLPLSPRPTQLQTGGPPVAVTMLDMLCAGAKPIDTPTQRPSVTTSLGASSSQQNVPTRPTTGTTLVHTEQELVLNAVKKNAILKTNARPPGRKPASAVENESVLTAPSQPSLNPARPTLPPPASPPEGMLALLDLIPEKPPLILLFPSTVLLHSRTMTGNTGGRR